MPKTYKVTFEASAKIRKEMKRVNCVIAHKRMEAVALRGEGLSNGEIARIKGYHPDYVSKLVCDFVKFGMEIFEDKRAGGNRRNLTDAEELTFLEGFRKEAEKGQVVSIDEIAAAYDELTGKERKSNSTVYYLLQKHGWRIVIPRGQHPKKASEEDIASSKKLTLDSKS